MGPAGKLKKEEFLRNLFSVIVDATTAVVIRLEKDRTSSWICFD